MAVSSLEHLAGPSDVHLGQLRPRRVAGEAPEVDYGICIAKRRIEHLRVRDRALEDLHGFFGCRLRWADDVQQSCRRRHLTERGTKIGPEPPGSSRYDERPREAHPASGSEV